jgi:hypothetical protein
MDDAIHILDYLPLSFKTKSEQDYIAFLWDAFETNYTHSKYQFAFLAYHMLTMSFVYFKIWQIKQHQKDDFKKATIGFGSRDLEGLIHKDDADDDKRWTVSPFNFSKVQERAVVRILALIGCDKSKIGKYVSLVDDRNESAHSNGNVFFSTQGALDTKIAECVRVVDEIQTHSKPVIEHAYREFLFQSYDPDEREFTDAKDQLREVLIHKKYLSQEDINICLGFDLSSIADRPEIDSIRTLHEALKAEYLY